MLQQFGKLFDDDIVSIDMMEGNAIYTVKNVSLADHKATQRGRLGA